MSDYSLTPKPQRPFFSAGPCAKPPGWKLLLLDHFLEGRSHRSAPALAQLQELLAEMRSLLKIPTDYHIAIVPGSATGAFEMGLWNFLGACGVDVWSFDVFGRRWADTIRHELKVADTRFFDAPEGELPPLGQADFTRDQVFTWCGTTAGVWLQDISWIPLKREGLTLCDATSAVFTTSLPWSLLDVTAFSWQKGLGGEGGHGMIVLSPAALERLKVFKPSWPVPKILRLRDDSFITRKEEQGSLFSGFTLNTPSLLAVADCLWALNWAKTQGGMVGLMKRVQDNFSCLEAWVMKTPWVSFFARDPQIRSRSVVCLEITDPLVTKEGGGDLWDFYKNMTQRLEREGVAFDCLNHTLGKPGLRIWCGPTIERQDLELLFPWMEKIFQESCKDWKGELKKTRGRGVAYL